MLYRSRLTASLAANLWTALAVLTLGVIGAPVSAMEEVTAYGAQPAVEARVQEAQFRAEMEAFAKTVELGFKASLAFDLKQSVAPPLRLAEAHVRNRG